MVQLIPLPLTVSCSSKIQIGFTFLVPAHPGSPGQRAVKWVCVLSTSEFILAEQYKSFSRLATSVFPARRAMLTRYRWYCSYVLASVCLCLCLSQAGIVSKRLNGSSWFSAGKFGISPRISREFLHGTSIVAACCQLISFSVLTGPS